jgi:hypothetical protein
MTTPKLFCLPMAHRSGAILAAAFLLLAGAHEAGATPSTSSASGSSESSTATATCPDQVRITLGKITVSGGMVTFSFTHNAHGCPSAKPALLHLHQNLLSAPVAGSDPEHQWNADLSIGPNSAEGVTVPLLESADGKCFVQVDAHASGQTRGQFFPTTTCSSASPSTSASTSTAPSTTASTSTAPSTTASTSTAPSSSSAVPTRTSQSFLPESTSRTSAPLTLVPAAQSSSGGLAATGSSVAAPVGVAAGLLIAGAGLMLMSRRPRRH